MWKWFSVASLLWGGQAQAPVEPSSVENETIFDYEAILQTPLKPRVLKKTEKGGIVTEEVMFHSERDGEKDVDIFAYFSYPKNAVRTGKKLPAFVWNQGGLSRASAFRTEMGAKRGYATLCIDFPQPGYRSTGNYAINTGIELKDDPRQAPIYHGAVALLKAVSYLQARPEVDGNRIGMAGSSWGGFYTTLMVGLDARLKVGACMYGAGNVQMGNMWWDSPKTDKAPAQNSSGQNSSEQSTSYRVMLDPKKQDPAFRERWRVTLDPALRLLRRQTPLAWFTGTNDWFYWMPSVMETYGMASGARHLSLVPNWDHMMPPSLVEQTFTWLDVHLKNKPAFSTVTPLQIEKRGEHLVAKWSWSGPRQAKSADLILSSGEDGNWHSRYWKTIKSTLKGQQCEAVLPSSKLPYYISGAVIDTNKFRYSTPLLKVNPVAYGIDRTAGKVLVPDYNGCAEWGSFEKQQVQYLKDHRLPVPALSRVAKEGKRSAVLRAGKATLPYILFTAGVPHRFSCYMRANKPTKIALKLYGKFEGAEQGVQKQFVIKKRWTKVTLEFTPPGAPQVMKAGDPAKEKGESGLPDAVENTPKVLSGALIAKAASGVNVKKLPRRAWFAATFSVPKGVTAKLDAVSFRPMTLTAAQEEQQKTPVEAGREIMAPFPVGQLHIVP
jgi:dienelactone hydrolase